MKREPMEPQASRRRLVNMRIEHLDAVMQIEIAAYAVPWSRGNFVDSLTSGCIAHCLFDERCAMLGYCVAMLGAGELHLLNLTVAPSARHRGHARHMLEHLARAGIAGGAEQVWLEVRASNERARHLYRRFGFDEVGLRSGYYPLPLGAGDGRREDAITMTLVLAGGDR
jgi:[ribosomal protein S18]-alanine N-acetyltransferase